MAFKWIDRSSAVQEAAADAIKHGYSATEAAKIFLIAPYGGYVKRAVEISERQLKRFINDVERAMERKKVKKYVIEYFCDFDVTHGTWEDVEVTASTEGEAVRKGNEIMRERGFKTFRDDYVYVWEG